MFQRIVVPLDGSAYAEQAIPIASRLARVSGGSLVFVHVILPPVDFGKYTAPRLVNSERIAFENNQARATSYLASILIKYAHALAGIDVDMGVAVGLVPETICSIAYKEQADLIILGQREETGVKRWFLGSIAQETMRRSSVPILVLNARSLIPRISHSAYPLRAQVILDGSPMSETALDLTAKLLAALAAPAQGILHLVYGVNLSLSSDTWIKLAMQEAEKYLAGVIDRFYKGPLASLELEITSSVVDCIDLPKTIFKTVENIAKSELEGASNLIALTIPGNRSTRHHIEKSLTKHILGSTRLSLLTTFPHEIASQSSLR